MSDPNVIGQRVKTGDVYKLIDVGIGESKIPFISYDESGVITIGNKDKPVDIYTEANAGFVLDLSEKIKAIRSECDSEKSAKFKYGIVIFILTILLVVLGYIHFIKKQ